MVRLYFIIFFSFVCMLGELFGQYMDRPYDGDFSNRILGFVNPTNEIDMDTWAPNYAGYIVDGRDAGSLNQIYIQVLDDVIRVYRQHGLSISGDLDKGRFEVLQEAINSRVEDHNEGVAQTQFIGSSISGGLGLIMGGVAGWIYWKQHHSKGSRLRKSLLGGLLAGGCGVLLGSLGTSLFTQHLPRFDANNPVLVEKWAELESLPTTTP